MEESVANNHLRIPAAIGGIQVNFCKNPLCSNYGIPASNERQARGRNQSNTDSYTLSGGHSGHRHRSFLLCKKCGEYPPIKSNLGIFEELERMENCFSAPPEPSCPNVRCENHGLPISTPKAYYSFGKTKSGSQRYRCRLCETTFAVGRPTLRQKRPEVNESVFKLLVNKVPFNRIMEVADISASTLYGKIDFIHKQCLVFAAAQESRLRGMEISRLYLSVDRQDYMINWPHASDKRNIVLSAVGTADNDSGYIFGCHLNYDMRLGSQFVEADATDLGDHDVPPPFRRYARLWLSSDYEESLKGKAATSAKRKQLLADIETVYNDNQQRDDIERPDTKDTEVALPFSGIQVHSEYTLYGHFFFLKRLLPCVEKFRFYMDQESGIRAACLAAFCDEVLQKRSDAFYVRVNKELTINQKRRLKAESDRELNRLRESSAAYADLFDKDLRHILIRERMKHLVGIGKWNDRWLVYPFPDMSEPEKAICWLTDLHDKSYDADHLANLYSKATLHGIDRFFMQIRRRISLLERPISTSSAGNRRWYGYGPYNPAVVVKLLDIFRVFYNFVEIGKDKKTPAMRLGLTETTITMRTIIYD